MHFQDFLDLLFLFIVFPVFPDCLFFWIFQSSPKFPNFQGFPNLRIFDIFYFSGFSHFSRFSNVFPDTIQCKSFFVRNMFSTTSSFFLEYRILPTSLVEAPSLPRPTFRGYPEAYCGSFGLCRGQQTRTYRTKIISYRNSRNIRRKSGCGVWGGRFHCKCY